MARVFYNYGNMLSEVSSMFSLIWEAKICA